MHDKLRAYIETHKDKEELDVPLGHASRFQKRMQSRGAETKMIALKWVASLAILVGVGWLFYHLGKIQATSDESLMASTPIELPQEFQEAESFFVAQVAQKKKAVLVYEETHGPAINQLMNELVKLEQQYEELKSELAVNTHNERIINSMIENYRTRLAVLEKLLKKLNNSNQYKNKHHVEIQA